MKILLIAGHGEGDPGAVALGYQEATLTRELLKLIRNKLSKYAEVFVFDVNKNPYAYFRKTKYNFKKYDYVFEIHFNAAAYDRSGDGRTTGTEILVHYTEDIKNGCTVEESILKHIASIGFRNRGIKPRSGLQNMNICKGNQGVSYALLETCFIDDKDDMELYAKRKDAVAYAVASGIAEGFGLSAPESPEQKEIDEVDEMTREELKELIIETVTEMNESKAKEPVGNWAADSFNKAKEKGILDGSAPKSPLTREQTAAVLDRLGLLK